LQRHDPGPRRNGETEYAFLNRVSGEFWGAVRDLIEDFVGHIEAADARADLTNRMKSGDDDQFESAWWEVYLHESLRRSRFDIEIHPPTSTSRSPDFLARRSDSTFYLEAIVPGQSKAAKATAARQGQLLSALDKLDTGRYSLNLRNLNVGANSAPASTWAKRVGEWVHGLPIPETSRIDLYSGPSMTLSDRDWLLELGVIPRKGSGARSDRGAIGIYPMVSGIFEPTIPVREALKKKYHKYGPLNHPFIIAVNMRSIVHDDESVESALFGTLAVEISFTTPSSPSEMSEPSAGRWIRRPDGFWSNGDAWINEHVTGVLVGDDQAPYFTATKQPTLWLHPTAEMCDAPVPTWPSATVSDGSIVRTTPADTYSFFDLPGPWPPGQRFPSL
jgi:hypothetical protein